MIFWGYKKLIQYVITKDIYSRLLSFKGKNLFCKRCSKELKIGDHIKGSRNSGTSKLYHAECYDQMFIDLEDEQYITH
jgi:hypothetical protein